MRRALRWTGIAVAGLLGLAVLGYIVVYALSERVLRRTRCPVLIIPDQTEA